MDLEIFKLRNVLAVFAALGLEFLLSHLGGIQPFSGPTGADKYGSFLIFLLIFLVLFWVIEKLFVWLVRR